MAAVDARAMTISCVDSVWTLEFKVYFLPPTSAGSAALCLLSSPTSPSSCLACGEAPWSAAWPPSGWEETSWLQVGTHRRRKHCIALPWKALSCHGYVKANGLGLMAARGPASSRCWWKRQNLWRKLRLCWQAWLGWSFQKHGPISRWAS